MPTEEIQHTNISGVTMTGGRYDVSAERAHIAPSANVAPVILNRGDAADVRRGGVDVVVTRRHADPIVCACANHAAARLLESALLRVVDSAPQRRRPTLL